MKFKKNLISIENNNNEKNDLVADLLIQKKNNCNINNNLRGGGNKPQEKKKNENELKMWQQINSNLIKELFSEGNKDKFIEFFKIFPDLIISIKFFVKNLIDHNIIKSESDSQKKIFDFFTRTYKNTDSNSTDYVYKLNKGSLSSNFDGFKDQFKLQSFDITDCKKIFLFLFTNLLFIRKDLNNKNKEHVELLSTIKKLVRLQPNDNENPDKAFKFISSKSQEDIEHIAQEHLTRYEVGSPSSMLFITLDSEQERHNNFLEYGLIDSKSYLESYQIKETEEDNYNFKGKEEYISDKYLNNKFFWYKIQEIIISYYYPIYNFSKFDEGDLAFSSIDNEVVQIIGKYSENNQDNDKYFVLTKPNKFSVQNILKYYISKKIKQDNKIEFHSNSLMANFENLIKYEDNFFKDLEPTSNRVDTSLISKKYKSEIKLLSIDDLKIRITFPEETLRNKQVILFNNEIYTIIDTINNIIKSSHHDSQTPYYVICKEINKLNLIGSNDKFIGIKSFSNNIDIQYFNDSQLNDGSIKIIFNSDGNIVSPSVIPSIDQDRQNILDKINRLNKIFKEGKKISKDDNNNTDGYLSQIIYLYLFKNNDDVFNEISFYNFSDLYSNIIKQYCISERKLFLLLANNQELANKLEFYKYIDYSQKFLFNLKIIDNSDILLSEYFWITNNFYHKIKSISFNINYNLSHLKKEIESEFIKLSNYLNKNVNFNSVNFFLSSNIDNKFTDELCNLISLKKIFKYDYDYNEFSDQKTNKDLYDFGFLEYDSDNTYLQSEVIKNQEWIKDIFDREKNIFLNDLIKYGTFYFNRIDETNDNESIQSFDYINNNDSLPKKKKVIKSENTTFDNLKEKILEEIIKMSIDQNQIKNEYYYNYGFNIFNKKITVNGKVWNNLSNYNIESIIAKNIKNNLNLSISEIQKLINKENLYLSENNLFQFKNLNHQLKKNCFLFDYLQDSFSKYKNYTLFNLNICKIKHENYFDPNTYKINYTIINNNRYIDFQKYKITFNNLFSSYCTIQRYYEYQPIYQDNGIIQLLKNILLSFFRHSIFKKEPNFKLIEKFLKGYYDYNLPSLYQVNYFLEKDDTFDNVKKVFFSLIPSYFKDLYQVFSGKSFESLFDTKGSQKLRDNINEYDIKKLFYELDKTGLCIVLKNINDNDFYFTLHKIKRLNDLLNNMDNQYSYNFLKNIIEDIIIQENIYYGNEKNIFDDEVNNTFIYDFDDKFSDPQILNNFNKHIIQIPHNIFIKNKDNLLVDNSTIENINTNNNLLKDQLFDINLVNEYLELKNYGKYGLKINLISRIKFLDETKEVIKKFVRENKNTFTDDRDVNNMEIFKIIWFSLGSHNQETIDISGSFEDYYNNYWDPYLRFYFDIYSSLTATSIDKIVDIFFFPYYFEVLFINIIMDSTSSMHRYENEEIITNSYMTKNNIINYFINYKDIDDFLKARIKLVSIDKNVQIKKFNQKIQDIISNIDFDKIDTNKINLSEEIDEIYYYSKFLNYIVNYLYINCKPIIEIQDDFIESLSYYNNITNSPSKLFDIEILKSTVSSSENDLINLDNFFDIITNDNPTTLDNSFEKINLEYLQIASYIWSEKVELTNYIINKGNHKLFTNGLMEETKNKYQYHLQSYFDIINDFNQYENNIFKINNSNLFYLDNNNHKLILSSGIRIAINEISYLLSSNSNADEINYLDNLNDNIFYKSLNQVTSIKDNLGRALKVGDLIDQDLAKIRHIYKKIENDKNIKSRDIYISSEFRNLYLKKKIPYDIYDKINKFFIQVIHAYNKNDQQSLEAIDLANQYKSYYMYKNSKIVKENINNQYFDDALESIISKNLKDEIKSKKNIEEKLAAIHTLATKELRNAILMLSDDESSINFNQSNYSDAERKLVLESNLNENNHFSHSNKSINLLFQSDINSSRYLVSESNYFIEIYTPDFSLFHAILLAYSQLDYNNHNEYIYSLSIGYLKERDNKNYSELEIIVNNFKKYLSEKVNRYYYQLFLHLQEDNKDEYLNLQNYKNYLLSVKSKGYQQDIPFLSFILGINIHLFDQSKKIIAIPNNYFNAEWKNILLVQKNSMNNFNLLGLFKQPNLDSENQLVRYYYKNNEYLDGNIECIQDTIILDKNNLSFYGRFNPIIMYLISILIDTKWIEFPKSEFYFLNDYNFKKINYLIKQNSNLSNDIIPHPNNPQKLLIKYTVSNDNLANEFDNEVVIINDSEDVRIVEGYFISENNNDITSFFNLKNSMIKIKLKNNNDENFFPIENCWKVLNFNLVRYENYNNFIKNLLNNLNDQDNYDKYFFILNHDFFLKMALDSYQKKNLRNFKDNNNIYFQNWNFEVNNSFIRKDLLEDIIENEYPIIKTDNIANILYPQVIIKTFLKYRSNISSNQNNNFSVGYQISHPYLYKNENSNIVYNDYENKVTIQAPKKLKLTSNSYFTENITGLFRIKSVINPWLNNNLAECDNIMENLYLEDKLSSKLTPVINEERIFDPNLVNIAKIFIPDIDKLKNDKDYRNSIRFNNVSNLVINNKLILKNQDYDMILIRLKTDSYNNIIIKNKTFSDKKYFQLIEPIQGDVPENLINLDPLTTSQLNKIINYYNLENKLNSETDYKNYAQISNPLVYTNKQLISNILNEFNIFNKTIVDILNNIYQNDSINTTEKLFILFPTDGNYQLGNNQTIFKSSEHIFLNFHTSVSLLHLIYNDNPYALIWKKWIILLISQIESGYRIIELFNNNNQNIYIYYVFYFYNYWQEIFNKESNNIKINNFPWFLTLLSYIKSEFELLSQNYRINKQSKNIFDLYHLHPDSRENLKKYMGYVKNKEYDMVIGEYILVNINDDNKFLNNYNILFYDKNSNSDLIHPTILEIYKNYLSDRINFSKGIKVAIEIQKLKNLIELKSKRENNISILKLYEIIINNNNFEQVYNKIYNR